MCSGRMHVSGRNSASLAWRCAGYERESKAVDSEKGVTEGLRPYIKRTGEAPVDEWTAVR